VLLGTAASESDALKYLIVRMNREQGAAQFELLPLLGPGELVSAGLSENDKVSRTATRDLLPTIERVLDEQFEATTEAYRLGDTRVPDRYVLVSPETCFDDNFYSTRSGRVSVIALGNWQRHMAPPSLVEFILTLLIREAVATMSPALSGSTHLGTRGCVMDFTSSLDEVRFKVLTGHICDHCAGVLLADRGEEDAADIAVLSQLTWLGDPAVGSSPAHTAALLGHNLYVNRAIEPTFVESIRTTLRQQSVPQMLTIVAGLVTAGLIVLFNLK
jgi:hypothetical protein